MHFVMELELVYLKLIGVIFFILAGIEVFIFSINNRKNRIKKEMKNLIINEIMIGSLFIFNGIIFPFIFSNSIQQLDFGLISKQIIEGQTYYLIMIGLISGIVSYFILILMWALRNYKKNRLISKSEWEKQFLNKVSHRRTPTEEFKRKYFPIIIGLVIISIHLVLNAFKELELIISWNQGFVEMLIQYMFLVTVLFLTFIKENIRLININLLSEYIKKQAPYRYFRQEFYTFTSRMPLFLSIIPFVYFGNSVFYTVAIIATLSDSSASIIGKQFSKFHPDFPPNKKTPEGHIAGFLITFLIIFIVNLTNPFNEINKNEINIIAFGVALIFLLIDVYGKYISDNILNPVLCGLTLVGLLIIFQKIEFI